MARRDHSEEPPPHAPFPGEDINIDQRTGARDLTFEKGLPANLEAERFILGTILLNDSHYAHVAEVLQTDDFALESHKRIFARMKDVVDHERRVDRVTVAEELIKQGQLESVGGLAFLASLDDGLPEIQNIESYLTIVREKSTLRKMIVSAQKMIDRCLMVNEAPEQILIGAEVELRSFHDTKNSGYGKSTGEIVEEFPGGVGAFLDPSQRIRGLQTGFTKLDEMTSGFQAEQLILLAARPAVGKTALAMNIASNITSRTKDPDVVDRIRRRSSFSEQELAAIFGVSVFSLEMSAPSLVERLLCGNARVDQHKFRAGYLNQDERRKLQTTLQKLVETPIFVNAAPGATLEGIGVQLRRDVRERGVKLGVVDYIQLMSSKAENRNQEVSGLSRGLKLLAKELQIPLLVLSQLSRAVETRTGDKTPQLSDLRDSGCVAGSSLVTLADGTRRQIRDLVGADGLSVMGLNQDTLQMQPYAVSKVFPSGNARTFRLGLRSGREIVATENHCFLTIDGWKRLDEIQVGKHLAVPRELSNIGKSSMSRDELALLGHLIGNGSTVQGQPTRYTTFDEDVAQFVAATAKRMFGSSMAPHVEKQRNHWNVFFNSTKRHTHGVRSDLRIWLESFGLWDHRSLTKFIPEKVFGLPVEDLVWFMGNLWSTDGCISDGKGKHAGIAYYSTSSSRLAVDVQYALTRLGIRSKRTALDQALSDNQNWHVAISGNADILRFSQLPAIGERRQGRLIGLVNYVTSRKPNTNIDVIPAEVWISIIKPRFRELSHTDRSFHALMGWRYSGSTRYKHCLSREHAARIAKSLQISKLKTLSESDIYWDRVQSITPGEQMDVFDMTVPGCENFVADNVIVHNSLEQDADIVMFIHREELFKRDRDDLKGLADLIIGKQRNGPIGKVPLRFLGAYTRFENRTDSIAEEDAPPAAEPAPSEYQSRMPYGDE